MGKTKKNTRLCHTCCIGSVKKGLEKHKQRIAETPRFPPTLSAPSSDNLQQIKINFPRFKNRFLYYFAADSDNFSKEKKQPDIKYAYFLSKKMKNKGVIRLDSKGGGLITLMCPLIYQVDLIPYPRHVHYVISNKGNKTWGAKMYTQRVICNVGLKYVHEYKAHHLMLNASTQFNKKEHIPGTYSLAYLAKDKNIQLLKKLREIILKNYEKKHKFVTQNLFEIPIITYCANSNCIASKNLAERLCSLGFLNVKRFPGGMKEWNS